MSTGGADEGLGNEDKAEESAVGHRRFEVVVPAAKVIGCPQQIIREGPKRCRDIMELRFEAEDWEGAEGGNEGSRAGAAGTVQDSIKVGNRDDRSKAGSQKGRASNEETSAQNRSRLPSISPEESRRNIEHQEERAEVEVKGVYQTNQRDC